jgi:hypothetical protein
MGNVDNSDDAAAERERARKDKRNAERADALMKGCLWTVLAVIVLVIGGVWHFLSNFSWTKGRPLRGRRDQRLAARDPEYGVPTEAAAHHWQHMAQEEYESIAAFSELALDLMAAGAPVELVTRCHEAALEEARHTAICLDVTSRLSGRVSGIATPSRLRTARRRPRWRRALLVRLAVESYVDGWVGEASSARVLAQLARDSRDDQMRDSLRVLAREEMQHAALGEDIVRWCNKEGGRLVEHALLIAQKRLSTSKPSFGDVTESVSLRHLGVPDGKLRAAALEAATSGASFRR